MSETLTKYNRLHPEEADAAHVWHPFAQTAERNDCLPLSISHGEGCRLFDEEGNEYLDGYAATWTNVHGYRDADLDSALVEQLGRVAHSTYLGLAHDPGARLAKRLVGLGPEGLSRVFYSDNGSGAVEVALKQALRYRQLVGQSERTVLVAMENAYHGDTFATMSLGGDGPFNEPWRPWALPVRHFKAPTCLERDGAILHADSSRSLASLERLLEEEDGKVAAVVLEPSVQGAAGMIQQPPGFVAEVEKRCREAGSHLILDEVFTGFGRLGSMLACMEEGIQPDFLCLAKGLTGGYLPLAATLTTEEIFDAFTGPFHEHKTFYHGHTFTGNPLAAAVALSNVEKLEARLTDGSVARTVETFGGLFTQTFADHPRVAEARQRGLTACLDLRPEPAAAFPVTRRFARDVCLEARRRGLLLRPLGNALPLVPPIAISDDDLARLCSTTLEALEATPV